MKRKQSRLWSIIMAGGVATTLLFVLGFGLAVADIIAPASIPFTEKPESQAPLVEPERSEQEINIVSLGDSLTRGTGDETGQGYVRRAVAQLSKEQTKPVKLVNNLAINGQRADQLVERLKQQSVGNTLKQANVIFLTIGGNDLFQSARDDQMSNNPLNAESLKAKVEKGTNDAIQVLNQIREWNESALIVYVGLYNPFSDLKEMHQDGNEVVQQWNDTMFNTINKDANMIMIPTQDLFERNIGKYLSSDHFHPNGIGYEAIATRVVQSIK
ncbi:GDSL-type esterase/lipase family protein [Paenibacillus arenosi]|nr:GDSL-type esterase/lipase family protein [Paenibacillus arenosi]